MAFCKECAAVINDGVKYCTVCGAPQIEKEQISEMQKESTKEAEIGQSVKYESIKAPTYQSQPNIQPNIQMNQESHEQSSQMYRNYQPQQYQQPYGIPSGQPIPSGRPFPLPGQPFPSGQPFPPPGQQYGNQGSLPPNPSPLYAQIEPPPGSPYCPVSVGVFVGYTLLFMIPLVGMFIAIAMACSASKVSLRNYARAYLIILLCVVVLLIIGFLLLNSFYPRWIWRYY